MCARIGPRGNFAIKAAQSVVYSPGPREPRDGRRNKRQAELLAVAAEVFFAHGYADSSVQQIADSLGILKGSIYHYIDTKEDLLFWLLESVHTDVEAILVEVIQLSDLAPLERLAEYVRRQVLYNLTHLPTISVYYHDVDQLSEDRLRDIRPRRKTHEEFVESMIVKAQVRGEVDPDLQPQLLANCVFATIIWVYRWYRPTGRVGKQALAELCARYAIAGLTGTPASSAVEA